MNGKGASKMRMNLGADVVVYAEGNTESLVMVRAQCPSGVCAAGMLESVHCWNLGDPDVSLRGGWHRSSTQGVAYECQEVGWVRSTGEAR